MKKLATLALFGALALPAVFAATPQAAQQQAQTTNKKIKKNRKHSGKRHNKKTSTQKG